MSRLTLAFVNRIADHNKIPVETLIGVLNDLNKENLLVQDDYCRFAIEFQFPDGSWGQEERCLDLVWYASLGEAEQARRKLAIEYGYKALRISWQRLGRLEAMSEEDLQKAREKQ